MQQLSADCNSNEPTFSAIGVMALLLAMNLTTAAEVASALDNDLVSPLPFLCFGFFMICAVFLFYIFHYKGKAEVLLRQYKREARRDRIRGRIIIVAYMVFSFAFFIGFGMMISIRIGPWHALGGR
jgi:hypothetical protein